VNYFIPRKIAVDRDRRNRAHVFLVSHILGPLIGNVVPIALYVVDPAPGYQVAVLAISITSFWIFPFVLRAGAPYNPLALVSIQNLIFCILWSCYFYGGVTSPTLPWVLVIPLLAFFYLGSSKSLRAMVMIMFAANLAIFSGFYLFGYPIKNDLPIAAMQGLGLVSTIAASLYVAMMALYYAKIQASQTELESEMRQHMATASALRLATEEAELAGAAKAEFLAKMSHELRTPLNAVIGYSQILLEDAEDEGASETTRIQQIHSAGQHLLKLVNGYSTCRRSRRARWSWIWRLIWPIARRDRPRGEAGGQETRKRDSLYNSPESRDGPLRRQQVSQYDRAVD
jgi:signal transduction histidine kinase